MKSSLKIKIALFGILFLSAYSMATAKKQGAGNIKTADIDVSRSYIEWTGKKILGQHSGKVFLESGTFDLNKGLLAGGSFTIDMTSIKDTDLTDKDYNKKLVGHLKSADFFNVVGFPTATLKVTKVLKLTNKANSYNLTCDLTIKGITKSITFPATFKAAGKGFEGNATLTIDRTRWDVRYGSSSFFEGLGDKAILNDVELKVHVFSK